MNNTNDRLMKLSQWAKREFTPESIPCVRTLRSWVINGRVRGLVIDGRFYVYESFRFGCPEDISNAVDALIDLSK